MGEVYYAEVKCRNCKKFNFYYKVPFGEIVEEFLERENKKCKTCGCFLFKEKKEEDKK